MMFFLACLIFGPMFMAVISSLLPKSLELIAVLAGIGGITFLFLRLRKKSKSRIVFKRPYRT